MTQRRSTTETGIPLSLIPQVIACRIKKRGAKMYRIRIGQTHLHHYNISVRTKSLPKELRARCDRVPPPARQPFIYRDDSSRDDSREGEKV